MTTKTNWLMRFVLGLRRQAPGFPRESALKAAEDEWSRRDGLEPEEAARHYAVEHRDFLASFPLLPADDLPVGS